MWALLRTSLLRRRRYHWCCIPQAWNGSYEGGLVAVVAAGVGCTGAAEEGRPNRKETFGTAFLRELLDLEHLGLAGVGVVQRRCRASILVLRRGQKSRDRP
jgi:hypothetical protein